jgi:hypothetical protein
MNKSQYLTLTIQVHRESLEFEISNRGAESIRVWDRNNPWGWETLVLNISPLSQLEKSLTLRPKPRDWTRTGPVFVEIPRGGHHLVTLRPGDPEWDGLEQIKHLRDEPLRVSGLLQIPLSPEASLYNVFVGEVASPPRESEPPHVWLFGP